MIRHCEMRKRKKKTEDCVHHLPDDLLIQSILSRLPLPSLFRCTAVCKAWRRLAKETHALYGGTTMAKQALAVRYGDIRVITPTTARYGNNSNEAPIDISRQYSREWSHCDGNNGLLLYMHLYWTNKKSTGYTFHVCNPFTSKSVPLPTIRWFPGDSIYILSMLVFDPAVSHHYKVITIFGRSISKEDGGMKKVYDKVCVFSSEQAHMGWRRLEGGFSTVPPYIDVILHSINNVNETACLNGYAYRLGFRTAIDHNLGFENAVLRFNVKEERFDLFDSPPALDVPTIGTVWRALGKGSGYLQYIYNDFRNVRIWKLEEDGRSWALRHRICLNDICSYLRDACVILFCDNDEVLHFIGCDGLLHQYNIDQRKFECYQDKDGKPVPGGMKSLSPFLCCAIDPEFRRFLLRPRK